MLPDGSALRYVAVAGVGVGVLSLLLLLVLAVRFRRLTAAHRRLTGTDDGASFVEVLGRSHRETVALREDLQVMRDSLAAARADLSDALRHVAVVRYDAFGDMGGRLSFSAAMLDDSGDGLVLTSINGRSETRTYAKGVVGGGSKQALSPEELEAIEHATSGRQVPLPAPSGRRRRRIGSR